MKNTKDFSKICAVCAINILAYMMRACNFKLAIIITALQMPTR